MKLHMTREEKFKSMTETPVKRLILKMAAPTMVSMLVSSLYNMADTFFVGLIGTSATAAVGVVFPVMTIIQAFGFTCGHGSGNSISRQLGQKDASGAERMAATGFVTALLCGLVIMLGGLLFLEPLVYALGATETIAPYAVEYARYILIAAPWMTASLVLNNQLRLQGNALYAMIGITSGAVLNVGLDPLFIFTFGMGVSGAALATAISQFAGFVLLFIGTQKSGGVPIRIRKFSPDRAHYKELLRGGIPSLCRQGLGSFATIFLNIAAGPYGDAAIAAMTIVSKIMMLGASLIIGFGQGFQPVCGFNYGAGLLRRVREAFWFCVRVSFCVMLVMAVFGVLFAPQLIGLFRDDPAVIAFGEDALRYQCFLFPCMSVVYLSNMMLQTMGRSLKASVLAMARQGLFFIPAVFILPRLLGATGVKLCQPVADVLSLILTLALVLPVLREMRQASGKQSVLEAK